MAIPNWITLSTLSGSGDTIVTVTASTMNDLNRRVGDLVISGHTKSVTIPVYQSRSDTKILYRTSDHQALNLTYYEPYFDYIKSNTYDTVNDLGTIEFWVPPTQMMSNWTPSNNGRWELYEGYMTFARCTTLTEIAFPDSFIGINRNAFHDCTSLNKIDFGYGVRNIGETAFLDCSSLTDLDVYQQHVIGVGSRAFSGTALTGITIHAAQLHAGSQNGGIGGRNYETTDGHQYIYVPNSYEGVSAIGEFHTPGDYVAYAALYPSTSWTRTYDIEPTIVDFEINTTSIVCDKSGIFRFDIGPDADPIYDINVGVYSKTNNWTAYTESDDMDEWISFSPTSGGTGYTQVSFTSTNLSGHSLNHLFGHVVFDNGEEVKMLNVTHYTDLLLKYKLSRNVSHHLPVDMIGMYVDSQPVNGYYNLAYHSELLGGHPSVPANMFSGGTFEVGYGETGTTSLREVIIENGFERIGSKTFYNCDQLTSITSYNTVCPTFEADTFSGVSSTGVLWYPRGSDYSTWLSALGPGWTGRAIYDEPMTMTITSGGVIRFTSSIAYEKNGGTRQTLTSSDSLPVSVGDKVAFYNTRASYSGATFSGTTAWFKLSGNIMSICYGDNFLGETILKSADTFNSLFKGCSGLTDASDLFMPSTNSPLRARCYYQMFMDCHNLVAAPELYLANYNSSACTYMFANCYNLRTPPSKLWCQLGPMNNACAYMFQGCTALTTSPVIEATSIANYAAQYMFSGCTSLNAITCLTNYGISSTSYGCRGWVTGVPSGGTFTKRAGVTWGTGVNAIPTGWTVVEV